MDLAKVKADSTLTIRNADGYINHDVFTQVKNPDNAAASKWVTVEYALADLIACYDQLFAGEEYWTLAIPFGTIDSEGYFYMTKLAFMEAVEPAPEVNPLDDVTNLLSDYKSWMLLQNGAWKGANSNWDYKANISELTYDESYYIKNLTTKDARYQWIGENQSGTTYTDAKGVEKEIAQSYATYGNSNAHMVLVGGKLGSITKADLQSLADEGYTSLTFSFVYTDYYNGSQNSGYYTLDLEKVKADSTLNIRNADGYINHDVFKSTSSVNNAAARNWVTVEYAIADLIACYDQLFAGEEYWTLVVPYGSIGDNKLTEAGTVLGHFYMTKLEFVKE